MWDYRVIKRCVQGEDVFGIHECFFDENGLIFACTEEPEMLDGGSVEDLANMIMDTGEIILDTLSGKTPVLDIDDIPQEGVIDPLADIDVEDVSQFMTLDEMKEQLFGKGEEDVG